MKRIVLSLPAFLIIDDINIGRCHDAGTTCSLLKFNFSSRICNWKKMRPQIRRFKQGEGGSYDFYSSCSSCATNETRHSFISIGPYLPDWAHEGWCVRVYYYTMIHVRGCNLNWLLKIGLRKWVLFLIIIFSMKITARMSHDLSHIKMGRPLRDYDVHS